jgi:hypothetical protein
VGACPRVGYLFDYIFSKRGAGRCAPLICKSDLRRERGRGKRGMRGRGGISWAKCITRGDVGQVLQIPLPDRPARGKGGFRLQNGGRGGLAQETCFDLPCW